MLADKLKQAYKNDEQCLKLRSFVIIRQWIRMFHDIDFAQAKVREPILQAIDEIRGEETMHLSTISDHQILIRLRKFVQTGGSALDYQPSIDTSDSDSIVRNRTIERLRSTGKNARKGHSTRVWNTFKNGLNTLLFNDNENRSDATKGLFSSSPKDHLFEFIRPGYQYRSCLLSESSADITKCLCLVENQTFCSISWAEILSYPRECGESISKAIDHFNQACRWIEEEMQSPTLSINELSTILGKLIRIAFKCLENANFNTLLQIVITLQNSLNSRLKANNVWKRVGSREKALFADLKALCRPDKNFGELRKAMDLQELSSTPCIPFIGLYLSDLIAHDEIFKLDQKKEEHVKGLIYWQKCQKLAKVLRQVRNYQNRHYSFNDELISKDLLKHLRYKVLSQQSRV